MTCKDCIHYDICQIFSDQYGISKVYPSDCGFAKEKSSFIELPCKVGEKLYYVIEDFDEEGSNSFIFETKVVSIGFDKDGFFMSIELPLWKYQRGRLKVGVNIFKTYEEAENKLKELKEEDG